jgi:aminomethyltransferase
MTQKSPTAPQDVALLKTPLFDLQAELDGKFVPFAGYSMPVEYPRGIKHEHQHTRAQAGLFDVSHMGQIVIRGGHAAALFETLVPSAIETLGEYRQRYTVLTNARGGIIDDLMVTRLPDRLLCVVNAGCKHAVLAHLKTVLEPVCEVAMPNDRALLALQGPAAAEILGGLNAEVVKLRFLTAGHFAVAGIECLVHRCGYTGEDGFELSVVADEAEALARVLLRDAAVEAVGLGARDTLRLEAGLCLAGQDFDTHTTPVEAGLGWVIATRYLGDGASAARFPGAKVILAQQREGVARWRVGVRPDGRIPVRAGVKLLNDTGREVGTISSGGYGATVGGPVAMGYVEDEYAAAGTKLQVVIRKRSHRVGVVDLPFVPHRYFR